MPDCLYRKFEVIRHRPFGSSEQVTDCFVLRMDKDDPHARAALRVYADSCEAELPGLAAELRQWADAVEGAYRVR